MALTLEEWSWVATIVSSAVNIVLVTVSTLVAVYVYRWHRESARIESSRKLQDDLQYFNALVLGNEDLQALAVETHPWGSITKDDVIRMYRHFIWLNIANTMFDANARG